MYNNREREELIEKTKKVVTGWDEVEEERNVAWILDLACRNESIARGVEKLWAAVCAEVRADLAYTHTKCHPSPHTYSDPHVCNLTPPSHYYIIDYFV